MTRRNLRLICVPLAILSTAVMVHRCAPVRTIVEAVALVLYVLSMGALLLEVLTDED